ncbi:MAG: hypothetical protein KAV41_02715 [Candidatus Pacebacteria bacterium]|nr:hypothetical protein [Candidatus Paceibacterota bacterium]
MKKYLSGARGFLFLSFTPILVWAADIGDLITKAKDILKAVLPLIITLALIYFLWAVSQYLLAAGEKKNEAREHMIWGIIILFVMVSVWGLVGVLSATIF